MTRSSIDNMDTGTNTLLVQQNAFRYLYLISGRLAEVWGEYAPKGRDVFHHPINGEDALIFPVRTARREGRIRSVAIPFKKEPWAEILYEFFLENEDGNPFDIGHINETSRTYLQNIVKSVFHNHQWSRSEYVRRNTYEATDDQIIKVKQEDGVPYYLIEYPNEERYWKTEPVITATSLSEEKWRDFTCMHLREQRIVEIRSIFSFSDAQIYTYSGLWHETTKRSNVIEWDNIEPISERILEPLKGLASLYFYKFST
jgi:hypothetical protein